MAVYHKFSINYHYICGVPPADALPYFDTLLMAACKYHTHTQRHTHTHTHTHRYTHT